MRITPFTSAHGPWPFWGWSRGIDRHPLMLPRPHQPWGVPQSGCCTKWRHLELGWAPGCRGKWRGGNPHPWRPCCPSPWACRRDWEQVCDGHNSNSKWSQSNLTAIHRKQQKCLWFIDLWHHMWHHIHSLPQYKRITNKSAFISTKVPLDGTPTQDLHIIPHDILVVHSINVRSVFRTGKGRRCTRLEPRQDADCSHAPRDVLVNVGHAMGDQHMSRTSGYSHHWIGLDRSGGGVKTCR